MSNSYRYVVVVLVNQSIATGITRMLLLIHICQCSKGQSMLVSINTELSFFTAKKHALSTVF